MEDEEKETASQENINYKSIYCEKIPEMFLDKLIAKKHFSKFGKINRFILWPKRLSCTVEYESEDDASKAYMDAGNFNGNEFKVTYAEYEVGHVQNTEEWVDPDVQAELDSMSSRATPNFPRQTPATPTGSGTILPPTRSLGMAARNSKLATQPTAVKFPKLSDAQRNELEAIMRTPAHTIEDKYMVLDARDKLIRLTTIRQTDITRAERTKGICPDMCPEKERLFRTFQRQVSIFEQAEGDAMPFISHERAIKEYSRSSADQEVPLKHELRPENVLKMTMLYLMHNIMDLCNSPQTSLGEWFHFVWDRTRSIRKDITQQELCSLGAVELVEQCARFHIHCAARLVAEDPAVFDKKINAENLTKCLQTLKYMYHDLRLKNVVCSCESEFRSYIILLNLGDSNFLWELKQLPENIQKSNNVKRAIAFCNALQTNNYVRFFNMVRAPETSYLTACILLGYFNKLRLRALEAINKSHNWRKNDVFLPLNYLTCILGFEDKDSATFFFEYHGLQCDEERLMLNRMSTPDIEYSMERAINLVESKLTCSVGECVCGHPLEPLDAFVNHKPHNSFDENGMLRPEAWTVEDQLRGEAAKARLSQRKEQKQPVVPSDLKPLGSFSRDFKSTDSNLFKVPRASPPLSLKHQQKQTKSQLLADQTTSSIFSRAASQSGEFGLKSTNIFGNNQSRDIPSSAFSTATESKSIFKPVTTMTPLPSTSDSASGTTVAKPSFHFSNGGVFGGASTVANLSSGNIFGPRSVSGLEQPEQHEPAHSGNIFQSYDTAPPTKYVLRGELSVNAVHDSAARERAEQEKRMQELEREQVRKQKQLEEEQRKLRELEQQEALAKVEAEKKRKCERERLMIELAYTSEQIANAFYCEWLEELIEDIANEELTAYEELNARAQLVANNIFSEVVQDEVREIASSEYAVMCHDQLILQRYFERWREQVHKIVEHRKLMESTPMWVTTMTRNEQTKRVLHPSQSENMQMIKRYRHGEPCNFKQLLWEGPNFNLDRTVNLFDAIERSFCRRTASVPMRKYFKLVLTMPGEYDELPGFASLCNKWLKRYIQPPQRPKKVNGAYFCGMENGVAVCVRKVTGIMPLNELGNPVRNECDNADGIICFLSCVNLKTAYKRLHSLLKVSCNYKSLPIAFVVYSRMYDETKLSSLLKLNRLMEEGVISSYNFYGCSIQQNKFCFPTFFRRAVHFVARNCNYDSSGSEALEMQSFANWLETCLGEELWQRWQKSALGNPIFAKICNMPQHVVGLFNEAVSHLLSIAGADLQNSPEFPMELKHFVPHQRPNVPLKLEYFPKDWKSVARQQQLLTFLRKLHLPTIAKNQLPQPPLTIDVIELWLLDYASLCMPDDDSEAIKATVLAINAFIDQVEDPYLADLSLEDSFNFINYLHVMKPIICTIVKNTLQSASRLPTELIYHHEALIDYLERPWWLNYKPIEAVNVDYKLHEIIVTDPTEDTVLVNSDDVLVAIKEAERVLQGVDTRLEVIEKDTSDPEISRLMCDLDEKFDFFELAQRSGFYDADDISGDFNDKTNSLDNDTVPSNIIKRRRLDNDENSDFDEVLANATRIIKIAEKIEDDEAQLQLNKFHQDKG